MAGLPSGLLRHVKPSATGQQASHRMPPTKRRQQPRSPLILRSLLLVVALSVVCDVRWGQQQHGPILGGTSGVAGQGGCGAPGRLLALISLPGAAAQLQAGPQLPPYDGAGSAGAADSGPAGNGSLTGRATICKRRSRLAIFGLSVVIIIIGPHD
jgi:hypothetical protein